MDSAISWESKRKAFQKLNSDYPWLGDFCKQFQESVGKSDFSPKQFSPSMTHEESFLGNTAQNQKSDCEALISSSPINPDFSSKQFSPSTHADSFLGNAAQNQKSHREALNSPSSINPVPHTVQVPVSSVWDNPPPTVVPPKSSSAQIHFSDREALNSS